MDNMDYLTTDSNEIFNEKVRESDNNSGINEEGFTLSSISDGNRPGTNTPDDYNETENELVTTESTASYVVCDKPKIEEESFVNVQSNTNPNNGMRILHKGHCCEAQYFPFEVKRLTETAKIPTRGSTHAAGWDIYADEDVTIHPGKSNVVSTGISIASPDGTYTQLAPRSGLALRNGIDVGAGICDSDYRGEIKVILFNHIEDTPFEVHRGDRICQMIIKPYVVYGQLTEVNKFTCDTQRGHKGFGSTGMK